MSNKGIGAQLSYQSLANRRGMFQEEDDDANEISMPQTTNQIIIRKPAKLQAMSGSMRQLNKPSTRSTKDQTSTAEDREQARASFLDF